VLLHTDYKNGLTSVGYRVVDTCVLDPDKMGTRSQVTDALGHGGSFHSFA
jgi:hypothetical protein